jgi:diguanylate cyclase (GGDEF)-like protein
LERDRLERGRFAAVMAVIASRLRGHWAAAAAASHRQPLSLSAGAWFYYGGVCAAALAVAGYTLVRLPTPIPHLGAFAVLTGAAAIAQLYIVEAGKNQSYRTAIAFLVAAAVILPLGLLFPLVFLHYVPGWVKYRKKWLVQTFNIANTTLAVVAAGAVFNALSGTSVVSEPRGSYVLAGLLACVVFVAVNHVLLAWMIRLTSGKAMRATGLFSFESVSTDVGLAALGIGIAAFWSVNPWLALFVVAPLLLIHRALYVPELRELAQADAKTGLLNGKEFERVLDAEHARAARGGTTFSILMVDLDLLREINNAYGHLAGDIVIRGIADIFREQLRRYDVPSRFGGDEFCVLLPETPRHEAERIAERIRETVAEREFIGDVVSEPLHATVSIGIATYPDDAAGWKELVHHADLAAYDAKATRESLTAALSPGARNRAGE